MNTMEEKPMIKQEDLVSSRKCYPEERAPPG